MKRPFFRSFTLQSGFLCLTAAFCAFCLTSGSRIFASETCAVKECPNGFIPLFDGKTLDGWDADPNFWRVEDETIIGESTPEKKVAHNSFLILRKVEKPFNFEFLADFRISKQCNSGLSFRASETEGKPWNILGHHADIFDHDAHMGTFYFRGVQAWRGQKVRMDAQRKPVLIEQFAAADELMKQIDRYGWNSMRLVVQGRTWVLFMNGVKMAEVEEDESLPLEAGVLGFQMHAGPSMKIEFKNVFLKVLD